MNSDRRLNHRPRDILTWRRSTAIPGVRQVAAASLAGVVVGIALRGAEDGAWASHPKVPHDHLISINSYAEFETYCAWALDNSITQPNALERIRTVDDSRWADIRWLEFAGEEIACDDPHNQTYRIYFYTADNIDWSDCPPPPPGQHLAGCAHGFRPMKFDPASGHDEWPTFEVDLRTGDLTGGHGSTLVNHEVGHVLGLEDGDDDTTCAVPSIMHGPTLSEQCSWVPTDADATTVLALEPGGSTGWANFNFQGKTF